MRSAIVVLERRRSIPKPVWREPSCLRTFSEIDAAPLIAGAWAAHRHESTERGAVVVALNLDGSPKDAHSFHPMNENQSEFIGVFELSFLEEGAVKLFLREEECSRQLGSPRRRSHRIAMLVPWQPVRVLLNGRSSNQSEQRYDLLEFYFALCADPTPHVPRPTHLIDLQADLI